MKNNKVSAPAIIGISFAAGMFSMLASISFFGAPTGNAWTGILATISALGMIYAAHLSLREWNIPLRV